MTTRANRRHALLVGTASAAVLVHALVRRSRPRDECSRGRSRIYCESLRAIAPIDCPTPRCGGWAEPTGHAHSEGDEPPWYIEAHCKSCDESLSRWTAATDELVERLRRDGACSADDGASREARSRDERRRRP
ncbi:MAG: hypothetical protein JNK05_13635 [Myxococcales bacterium]|nr:hypothetical protein [Myxococcales bacterium]